MKIVDRSAWGARHPDGGGPAPLPAQALYLHHSVTPAPGDDPAAERRAMRQLEDIGQDRFGQGMSYTFAVMPSGRVYEGHSVNRLGAHTKGQNSTARGIVLVGDYSRRSPTARQIQAVADLVAYGNDRGWWRVRALTGGHRDVGDTACPGDAGYASIRWINAAVGKPAPEPTPAPTQETKVLYIVKARDSETQYLTDGITRRRLTSGADLAFWRGKGAKAEEWPGDRIASIPLVNVTR